MTRTLKIIFLVLFVICTLLFVTFFIIEKLNTDDSVPVLTVPADELTLSVNCTEEELLRGVAAYDEKDGDLTSRVIVESVSRFTEPGVSKVTYAVCDSDNHVTSRTVVLRYSDYTPPRITMSRSLCYGLNDLVNVSSVINAVDVFDGSLRKEIQLASPDYQSSTLGIFTINVSVSNSKGDYIEYDIPLYVEAREANAPSIVLEQYLIYIRKGESVDPMQYVKSVTDAYREDISQTLEIKSELDSSEPGLYSIHYFAEDKLMRRTHTVLTVIVEE